MKIAFQILTFINALALIAIIVAQPSKGEGLGSIGGGGQMFFAKNKSLEKLMDRVTTGLAISFGVLLMLMEIWERF